MLDHVDEVYRQLRGYVSPGDGLGLETFLRLRGTLVIAGIRMVSFVFTGDFSIRAFFVNDRWP